MKIVKKCIYCGGEIKSVEDFYKQDGMKEYEEHRKELDEMGIPPSENFNCIECGQVYNRYLKPMKIKLGWLGN